MNRLLLGLIALSMTGCTSGKISESKIDESAPNVGVVIPYDWKLQGEQNNVKWYSTATVLGKQTKVLLKAKIGSDWHLYSQHLESDMGPVATTFFSESNPSVIFAENSEVHKSYDESFAMNVAYFETEAIFEALMPTTSNEYSFTVSYMVCNDETCLPPVDQELKISIP